MRPVGGKWGYINRNGVFVIKPQFDMAFPFNEGFALVSKEGVDYALNKSGRLLFEGRAGFFSEGLAAVRKGSYREGKWGFIDKSGKYVIEPIFEDARKFSEGMAAIKLNGKWGFIKKDGAVAINPAYDAADFFDGGLAAVSIGGKAEFFFPFGAKGYADKDAKLGYINQNGNYVWHPKN